MAKKNARAALTTVMSVVYTAPPEGAMIAMIQVANVDGSNDVDATVQWTDASAANVATHLAFATVCKAKDAISVQAGGLWLDGGDQIRARASADGDAEITVVAIENRP